MDTSEINIIIEAIENENIESLIKYSNRNISANEYQKMDNESKKELINNIYENILSKITNIDKNNVLLYLYLLLETGGSITDFAMEYLIPEKVRELELDKYTVTVIIGAIENEQIRNRFLFEGQDINDDNFECNIANVIKATGKIDEYLTPERVKELGLDRYDIIKLIKATGEIENYLTPERVKELGLNSSDIANLIKATGKIEEYLKPEKVIKLRLDEMSITNLIKAIEDKEIRKKYLFEGQDINDYNLECTMANIIKATGKIEEYLTRDKRVKLGLSIGIITKLIKATGKLEEYLTRVKVEELKLGNGIIAKLIKATGKIEEYLIPKKVKELGLDEWGIKKLIKAIEDEEIRKKYLFEGQDIDDMHLKCTMANIIKATGKIEEYLIPEKVRELGLDEWGITELIKTIEDEEIRKKYLFEGQDINDENLKCTMANIIKATGKIEEYLTRDKRVKLGLSTRVITKLIKATGKLEEYLTRGKVEELKLGNEIIAKLIEATGDIEKYLTPEKAIELKLYDTRNITELIKAIEDEEIRKKYLFEGQDINDENLEFTIVNILKTSDKLSKRIEKLLEKNKNIYETFDPEFIINDEIFKNFSEEQLIRITNYPDVQKFIVDNYNNKCISESIKYLMKNDCNYIISLDRIIKNEDKYKDLIDNLKTIDINNIEEKEEFYQKLLCILSDTENYFEIQNYDDVINYYYKKDEFCLKILKEEDKIYIPEKLKGYNEDDLLRFALLEYKFGISLKEAKRIIKRYGTDSEELPDSVISDYIKLLKEIIESQDLKEIIRYANKNDLLEKPWFGFPNARNVEGKILNMFEELYNKTLYKTTQNHDDKYGKETYIETVTDEYGIQREIMHEIEVYNIKKEFCMNVRVEGAYSHFNEPDDFNDYYNNPNIENHGNCEVYIRNDNIAIPRNEKGVIVGYDNIQTNSLTSLGSYDLGTENTNFSIYNEENEFIQSNFRIPDEMINNTRYLHNELVKERVIVDKKGNVVKLQPSYVVWIEEETIEERMKTEWKEKRKEDSQWIMTKKLAAQLGIPIVVIDREYFIKRETEKLDMMVKILKGKEIEKYENYKNDNGNLSEIEYEKCKKEYKKLSKAELIKEIIIKFENNRTGLQFNKKLNKKYFAQNKLKLLSDEMIYLIYQLDKKEKLDCMQAYKDVVTNEYENLRYEDTTEFDQVRKDFYRNQVKKINDLINDIESESEVEKDESEEKTVGRQRRKKSNVLEMFSELYRTNRTDKGQVGNVSEKLSKDLKSGEKQDLNGKNHDAIED